MKTIPGGTATLRDVRANQIRQVEIQPFLISAYPVTQELYKTVTGNSPAFFRGDRLPVVNVSWFDAILFCNRFSIQMGLPEFYSFQGEGHVIISNREANGYRLPTEAEWQFACMAGTSEVRYGEVGQISWYRDNSGGRPGEVGLKTPNAWGLFDMLGNVWEWCEDLYDEQVYGTYRVFRGGGWNDPERGCLATNRRRGHPTFQIDDLGFRIAKNL